MPSKKSTPYELLERHLDGENLSPEELQLIQNHPDTKELIDNALAWKSMAENYQPQHLHGINFSYPTASESKQSKGPVKSWAMAACVGCLSLLSAQLWLQNENLEQSIALQKTQIAHQQDVVQKILTQMHKNQTLQVDLTNQVLQTNRAEREIALDDLLTYLQTQRAQDQAILRLQLNELTEQLDNAPVEIIAQNGGL